MPNRIESVDHLEDLLSTPTPGAIDSMSRLDGDLIILGVGGKMGPTLARLAKRADEEAEGARRIIAVSRFTDRDHEARLRECGLETIRCDLLDEEQLGQLPRVPNVLFMTGMKFGTTGQAHLTWGMNALLPSLVCRHFSESRIVAFSTGNVYGMVPVVRGGSLEADEPNPQGEYSMSALGRERVFEYYSHERNVPVALLRLNYATEMRYGVLVDIARQVFAEEAVGLSTGCLNSIWQGDANAMALQAFDHVGSPPFVVNIAGPEILSVRSVAEQFGELFGKSPRFEGEERGDAFLSNAQRSHHLFGYPAVGARQMIEWIADWVSRGGESLGKPTHFEVRDGKF